MAERHLNFLLKITQVIFKLRLDTHVFVAINHPHISDFYSAKSQGTFRKG